MDSASGILLLTSNHLPQIRARWPIATGQFFRNIFRNTEIQKYRTECGVAKGKGIHIGGVQYGEKIHV